MKIFSRYNRDQVLFESEKETIKEVVVEAVEAKSYLRGAYLSGADLRGAYLIGAYLSGADLIGADLRGADLRGAYLSGADLRGAYLSGAYLRGADLSGAYLRGAYLSGAYLRGAEGDDYRITLVETGRCILIISPIGSRNSTLTAYNTNIGIVCSTGCYFGTIDDFEKRVSSQHSNNRHKADYDSAISTIRRYFTAEEVEA